MRIFVVFLSILSVFSGCSFFNRKLGLKDDHALEEFSEDLLRNKTGVDLDFTPDSPE